jgi:hypothetical protein
MRKLVILICSLAFVGAYGAQKEHNKPQQKKQTQTSHPAQHPAGAGAAGKKMPSGASGNQNVRKGQPSTAYQGQKAKSQTPPAAHQGQRGNKAQTSTAAYSTEKRTKNQAHVGGQTGRASRGGQVKQQNKRGATAATQATNVKTKGKTAAGKPIKPQHFNVPKQPNTAKAPPVKFQQNRRIEGSQNWRGQQYTVFRNYRSVWHDQNWWHNHYHNKIVFVFGAPYYWNAGYWFPAWGYYPNAYYAWDGPIYGYNHLPPDQVIANVQSTLQQQGYYNGQVDGLIGPLTRGAIADYQRDHGLYVTSAIDQPTLESLGMA